MPKYFFYELEENPNLTLNDAVQAIKECVDTFKEMEI